jgi:hypothetical protein
LNLLKDKNFHFLFFCITAFSTGVTNLHFRGFYGEIILMYKVLSNMVCFVLHDGSSFLIIHNIFVRTFCNLMKFLIYSLNFGWIAHYDVVGYNYTLKRTLRRQLFIVHLGYSRHKILVMIPKGVRFVLTRRRRKLHVFGLDYNFMFKFILFFIELRNLFPYKYKGLVFFEPRVDLLKPGKKTKYR